jgi:acyl dehydratase
VTTPTIDAGIVGVTIAPRVSTIDARWLMAYAAALGETDPRYYDTTAAGGPLAHPLFPVCYEWPAALALRAKTIDDALSSLGVHVWHRLVLRRAPRAGDELRTSAQVIGVQRRMRGTLVVVRFTTVDRGGASVSVTDYGSLYRGVALSGADTGPAWERADDDAAVVRWTDEIAVGPQAAHVYTEGARIYNPIHTDIAAARAAGLSGLILHGTATLALAVSRVLARDLAGDPTAVRGVAGRFTGMVPMPATLSVRGRDARDGRLTFDVVDAGGRRVLTDGAVAR